MEQLLAAIGRFMIFSAFLPGVIGVATANFLYAPIGPYLHRFETIEWFVIICAAGVIISIIGASLEHLVLLKVLPYIRWIIFHPLKKDLSTLLEYPVLRCFPKLVRYVNGREQSSGPWCKSYHALMTSFCRSSCDRRGLREYIDFGETVRILFWNTATAIWVALFLLPVVWHVNYSNHTLWWGLLILSVIAAGLACYANHLHTNASRNI